MKISHQWLNKFIPDLDQLPAEIAEALSLSLAEVENVTEVNGDTILKIENKALSHRPDLFSQLGMARETAAALNKPLSESVSKPVGFRENPDGFNVDVDLNVADETLCPRYMAVVIDNLQAGESPTWMQQRLRSMGQRPINNIVDITNYVMHELGQPIHAFDVKKLETQNSKFEIGVRQAQKGETLTTIDGDERELSGGELVITSNNKPIALAGIMGGAETQVSNNTTTILLESANFNMYSVRKTSKTLGLRTEASLRFEKGLDPNLAEVGMRRCVELFKEITDGQVASEVADFYPIPVEPLGIEVDLGDVREFLGVELTNKQIVEYWNRLGLNVGSRDKETKKRSSVASVTVPTYRRDLTLPEDLYEEVARLHGYNNFTPTLPTRTIAPPLENHAWISANRIREVLVGLGLDEILTYSFIGHPMSDKHATTASPLHLQNPIAPEMAYLRTSLLPSLTTAVEKNAKRFDEFGVFEIGKVTRVSTKSHDLPDEPKMLAVAFHSAKMSEEETYLHTKGILETLLSATNTDEIADLTTTLNPTGLNSLNGAAYGFELELATLQELAQPPRFKPIPAHMPTYQDLSFIVDEDVTVREILSIIHNVGVGRDQPASDRASHDSPLRNLELTDIYQSDQLRAQHQKSLTVRLTFHDPDRPLSDADVNPIRKKIEIELNKQFDATIR